MIIFFGCISVMIIQLVCTIIIYILCTNKIIKGLVSNLIILISFLVIFSGYKAIASYVMPIKYSEAGLPMTHWIMMGLKGDGGYNKEDVDFTSSFKDKEKAKALLDSKIAMASNVAGSASSSGAVRITGQDSEIELNGATFTNNSNNYSINGLTIEAMEVTGNDEVTITTNTDVDGIYDMIKGFLKDYNDLVKSVDVAYNAASSKGYEPLTSDEKDAMSDDEVKKWEEKIKDSLLRKDSTLGSVLDTMKNDMARSFKVGDKSYSLSSFGIATLGYFNSPENETGVYHIDGDKDDTKTSANTDKLREMIASDPDTVISFFSQLSTQLYTDLGKKMAASSTSSAYTIYNDKQMNTQYSEYNTKISEAEDKVTTWEDYYYSKFSAMESALAKMNAQSSSLTGLFS